MDSNIVNPYQAPDTIGAERGDARFRLRPWFAVTLYLALLLDFASLWSFGFHPFLVSIPVFMLLLAASVFTRRFAIIEMREKAISYKDLVQCVELSWNRIVRVIHRPSKTVITTDSPLAQITLSRNHIDYEEVVMRLAERQDEFGFELSDSRSAADSRRN